MRCSDEHWGIEICDSPMLDVLSLKVGDQDFGFAISIHNSLPRLLD